MPSTMTKITPVMTSSNTPRSRMDSAGGETGSKIDTFGVVCAKRQEHSIGRLPWHRRGTGFRRISDLAFVDQSLRSGYQSDHGPQLRPPTHGARMGGAFDSFMGFSVAWCRLSRTSYVASGTVAGSTRPVVTSNCARN